MVVGKGVCYDQYFLLTRLSLFPSSFCAPRSNLPVIPGVSWIPIFSFCFPLMKRTSFLVFVLESLVGLHRTDQLQLLLYQWLGDRLGLLWYWIVCLEMNQDHPVVSETAPKYCISDSFVDWGLSISSKGCLCTVVDIMVIWIKFAHLHHLNSLILKNVSVHSCHLLLDHIQFVLNSWS